MLRYGSRVVGYVVWLGSMLGQWGPCKCDEKLRGLVGGELKRYVTLAFFNSL